MNKTNFIKAMAIEMDSTIKEATKAVDSFLVLVPEILIDEGKLQFPGFGTFTLTERAARKGRNPSTGD